MKTASKQDKTSLCGECTGWRYGCAWHSDNNKYTIMAETAMNNRDGCEVSSRWLRGIIAMVGEHYRDGCSV